MYIYRTNFLYSNCQKKKTYILNLFNSVKFFWIVLPYICRRNHLHAILVPTWSPQFHSLRIAWLYFINFINFGFKFMRWWLININVFDVRGKVEVAWGAKIFFGVFVFLINISFLNILVQMLTLLTCLFVSQVLKGNQHGGTSKIWYNNLVRNVSY